MYLVYLLVLVSIELSSALVSPALGAALHGILILVLLNVLVFKPDLPGGRLWAGLALVSLLRFFSLVLPLGLVPPILWTAVISLPLWLGIWLYQRQYQLPLKDYRLRWGNRRKQMLLALSGLPLGLVASLLIHPEPFYLEFNWAALVFGGPLIVVSVGLTEELLFRGLLGKQAEEALIEPALLFVSTVYASMYIGTLSPITVFFMGIVGYFWGLYAERTRSIFGVALAHGLMVAGMMLVWPYLLNA